MDQQSPVMQWASTVIAFVATLLTAYVLFRSRTPQILRDELQVTREKSERLEKENKDLVEKGHANDVMIAELKAKTDLTDIRANQHEILMISARTVSLLDSISKTMERLESKFQSPA